MQVLFTEHFMYKLVYYKVICFVSRRHLKKGIDVISLVLYYTFSLHYKTVYFWYLIYSVCTFPNLI